MRLARWRGWSAYDVLYMKQRNGCRTSCDIGKAAEGLENKLWRRWSDVMVGNWGRASFSNPYIASATLQLIIQHFRCFTYVTARSTTLPLLHLLYTLHLRHRSFSNPSAASSTSQLILQPFHRFTYVKVILQPFRCFTYVTGSSRTSPGEPPMHRGMKKRAVVD